MKKHEERVEGRVSCPVTLAEAIALRGMGFPTLPTRDKRENWDYRARVKNTTDTRLQIREALTGAHAKFLELSYGHVLCSIETELDMSSGGEMEFNGDEIALLLICDATIPFERNEKYFYIDIPCFALDEVEKKVGTYSRLFGNLHNKIKLLNSEGDEEV